MGTISIGKASFVYFSNLFVRSLFIGRLHFDFISEFQVNSIEQYTPDHSTYNAKLWSNVEISNYKWSWIGTSENKIKCFTYWRTGNDDDDDVESLELFCIKIYTGKENSISKNNNNHKIDSEQQ